jgi:cardiolipin synthase
VEKSTKPIEPRTFTVEGNHLDLLTGGKDRLEALIALIDGAESSLRLLYYIYAADEAGREVRDALDRALKRGVTIALIVDGFGSSASPEFFAGIRAAGADICRFLPKLGRRYLLRNHQKLALADEKIAIIGGFNIQNDYFDDAHGWRDLGLRIEGPAAARLAGYFDSLQRWTHREGSRLRDLRHALTRWSESDGGGKACWLLGGPMRRLNPWARALRSEIASAVRIDMIAAYFAPTPRMLRAIERVGKRGGQARIVTAAKSDNNATIAAARHTYHRLLRRKVRIFEYQPTKLHTKLFVIDDAVHIGSANFDVRSLFLNLEVMLRIEDEAFADYMRAYVDHEIAHSEAITRASHDKATWWDRVRWSWAYWLVAVVDGKVTRRLSFGVDRT